VQHLRTFSFIFVLTVCIASASEDKDFCDFCGREIQKTVVIITDRVTSEKHLICSDCLKLPRCSICDLPVSENNLKLSDGRRFCARDAKTLVLDPIDAWRIYSQVADDLDRLFSRFTSFPKGVNFSVIDKIDANSIDGSGNNFERSDLLGFIRAKPVENSTNEIAVMSLFTGRPKTDFGQMRHRYQISLLIGRPLDEFKATCAHELAHAWVGENVPTERKRISSDSFLAKFEQERLLGKDAEEGFCEWVSYMLMDSKHEEGQKKAILENLYTRSQTALFIETEKHYGINEILDWMKYGETAQLEAGHLDKIRDTKMPEKKFDAAEFIAGLKTAAAENENAPTNLPVSQPAIIKLQGIFWGSRPTAIINGRSFFANDQLSVKVGATNVFIRCLEIQKNSVRIQHLDSGKDEVLSF